MIETQRATRKSSESADQASEHTRLFGATVEVPSSAAQREIFGPSVIDPDASRAYNHSISIHLKGKLDIDCIYSALLNLLHLHEALRGSFSEDGDLFRVSERIAFGLPLVDLRAHSETERDLLYRNLVREEQNHVYDLVRGPLFRSVLFRMAEEHWVLLFSCHHVIVDGWSLKTILDGLPKLYSDLVSGKDHCSVDAGSFVEYLGTAVTTEFEKSRSVTKFWKNVFSDGVPSLDLPIDYPRPKFRTYRSAREDYWIRRPVFEGLKEIGAKGGVSTFGTLLSAFSLYLARITQQDDLVVGVPAAGQIMSGKGKLLGHDARLMPIRCQIMPGDSFRSYASRVMSRFFEAYENQWISMPELIRELGVQVDPARVPFAPVMFNFDPGVKKEDFKFAGLEAYFEFNHRLFETMEISVNAVVEDQDLVLECAYNLDLFDQEQMHRRLEQIERLMASIVENPDLPLRELALLGPEQIREMDEQLNATAMEYQRGLCVDQVIESVVVRHRRDIAVEFRGAQLSYGEVWEQAGQFASALLQAGAGRKPLVGVLVERSELLIPLLLGIWRAGGAFVPLDPNYPKERLEYIIEHSKIGLIVTERELKGAVDAPGVKFLDQAEMLEAPVDLAALGAVQKSAADTAYVIYTSGSTGRPKGVQVPHRALNNFLATMQARPGITSADRVLAVTTLSFDIAELELWLPLVSGARTVIVDRDTAIDGLALMETLEAREISMIQATPATWRLLIYSGWMGKSRITALCGGEALPRDLADDILKRVGKLYNVYGPTETTVWSTIDEVGPEGVTIGRPIGNTQTYLLDAAGSWVPQGVVGELWIGGDGVTDGYLHADELTAERFRPNNFTGQGRIYKTGDLARLRRDGRIEYVGRNDFQVKVRGFRIELGEVQHALASHPAVRDSAVIVQERAPGDAHLVGFYCLKPGMAVSAADLKRKMGESVPDYMLPSFFVELPELPLTPNGKINVKALQAHQTFLKASEASADQDFAPPLTDQERRVATVWTELLGTDRVGRNDRFLERGGTSLLAIRAINRIEKECGIRLQPRSMLVKTVEQLAIELGGRAISAPESGPQGVRAIAETPLFFGPEFRRKFGCYTASSGQAGFGVLVIPPMGQEYMRTHWLVKAVSASIARKGAPVFRLDLPGQGDSWGSSESVGLADFMDALSEAADDLKSRSGLGRIKIVAFRASALLASAARQRLGADIEMVLVDPPESGDAYFQQLRALQKKRWEAYPFRKRCLSEFGFEEILGSLYSRAFLKELGALVVRLGPTDSVITSAGMPVPPGAPASAIAIVAEPGWSDYQRLEAIWLSPEVVSGCQKLLFGAPS
ncbi:MAG: amino acid adenylation domain-containing protein [Bdellovibrionales bacterium]|nr:amino acid adenylation domain-containing protein [Bdellovibrionales bacterium]